MDTRQTIIGPAFVPGYAFYSDPAGDSELRLCFSSVTPATIEDAVKRLASSLKSLKAEGPRRTA